MKRMRLVACLRAGAVFAALVGAGLYGQASEDDENHDHGRIERGFDIAPVPLNLERQGSSASRPRQLSGQRRRWL